MFYAMYLESIKKLWFYNEFEKETVTCEVTVSFFTFALIINYKSMIQRIRYIFLLLLIFPGVYSGFAQFVDLPLGHWAYQFLDQLETKCQNSDFASRSLPMSRLEIASIIQQLEKSLKSENIQLTRTEMDRLEQLKGEFYEELMELNIGSDIRYQERHLFTWTEENSKIHADVDFGSKLEINRGDQYPATKRVYHTTLGGILRGNLKQSLGFHIFVRNTLSRGIDFSQLNFDPSKGIPIDFAGKNAYTDRAIAYFTWKLPWFQLKVGRDQAKWGPGYRGSLMLSAQNPLFDMIKLKARFKRFQFESIHGHLNSSYGRKYLAAHRLEIRVAPWLYVAGSEGVVYGNRNIEFQYLNPIMPYHVAEHHLGDQDNNTIGFDFTLFPLKKIKAYFELFIDDYTLSESVFHYYGNKFAFLTGGHWVEPFGLKNIALHLEFARVEPFVYTHHDSINSYQNYDQSIGHWLGPNADDWFIEANYNPNRDLTLTLFLEQVRKGEGDITQGWNESFGEKKRFLTGTIEKRSIYSFKITDQILRDVFVSLTACWIKTKNLDRVAGNNVLDKQVNFELLLNY